MILGVGTDIVKISRIARSVEKNPLSLAKRVLTANELEKYQSSPNPVPYLAKRYAAKEAASKAFGTGIGKISWHELEVINNSLGAPQLLCYGRAKQLLDAMGGDTLHISLSDEEDAALAFVVISRSS